MEITSTVASYAAAQVTAVSEEMAQIQVGSYSLQEALQTQEQIATQILESIVVEGLYSSTGQLLETPPVPVGQNINVQA